MSIWLHIGTGKTGTSSIQQFLFRNSTSLIQQSYVYPRLGPRHSIAHHNLATQLKQLERFDPALGTWERLRHILKKHPTANVILSSEGFQSLSIEQIERIRSHALGHQVNVLVYLRNQSSMAESWYSQRLKTSRQDHGTLEDFLERHIDVLTYSKLLAPWASVFGSTAIKIRIFERIRFVNGNLLDDFCSAVGLRTPSSREISYRTFEERNTSPGPTALAIQQAIRDQIASLASEYRLEEQQMQIAMTAVLRAAMHLFPEERKARLLSFKQRRDYDARFAVDNATVMRLFLPDHQGPLFSPEAEERSDQQISPSQALAAMTPTQLVELMVRALARTAVKNAPAGDTANGKDFERQSSDTGKAPE